MFQTITGMGCLGCTLVTLILSESPPPCPEQLGRLMFWEGDWLLPSLICNDEFLASMYHQPVQTTSLTFSHTACRSYRLSVSVDYHILSELTARVTDVAPPNFRKVMNCFGFNCCIDSLDRIPQELILTFWAFLTYFLTVQCSQLLDAVVWSFVNITYSKTNPCPRTHPVFTRFSWVNPRRSHVACYRSVHWTLMTGSFVGPLIHGLWQVDDYRPCWNPIGSLLLVDVLSYLFWSVGLVRISLTSVWRIHLGDPWVPPRLPLSSGVSGLPPSPRPLALLSSCLCRLSVSVCLLGSGLVRPVWGLGTGKSVSQSISQSVSQSVHHIGP